jgi:hypothetical protein
MDVAYVSTTAALVGSVVGGLTSGGTDLRGSGGTSVREYQLGYAASPTTNRPQLQTVGRTQIGCAGVVPG